MSPEKILSTIRDFFSEKKFFEKISSFNHFFPGGKASNQQMNLHQFRSEKKLRAHKYVTH